MPADLSRRDLVLGGAALGTAVAAAVLTPRRRFAQPGGGELARIVPERIGEWRRRDAGGIVRPPEDAVSDGRYDHELARTYGAGAALTMLLVAYGATQSDRLQVHRPEFCYPANGFSLTPTRGIALRAGAGQAIPACFFTARLPGRIEHVLYWVRIGDYFPRSWIGQHGALLMSSLRGLVPDGVLVRLSAIGPDAEAAQAQLEGFAAALLRLAPARRLLAGA